MSEDIRWHQRFENFERAFILLRTALEGRAPEAFNELEVEGLVQRFEYTFELAWKTLKDYLEQSGVVLPQITPNAVIKAAYAAKLIEQGETWMDMLKHRNLMSHTYDFKEFHDAVAAIRARYLGALQQVYLVLKKERNRMNFGLSETTVAAIRDVLARHPEVQEAIVFGSRALGRENPHSDVDIALRGNLPPLEAEGIALELEELPVPVRFDVQSLSAIHRRALLEHIERAGKLLYSRKPEP